ncbi:hypothetical protein POTOM_013145 [Populus tomentosa]|uniref:Uncharacterized protein n=1 Tax=Populus tomentosa TaxID=118781 RepID=A0A8X8CY78_POPTO|nr:hypothetical protein POTOM_013145 [Populus tomentosa]
MASNGVQSFASLQAALPPVSGVTQTIPNTVVQDPNMQSIPGVSQKSTGNSMGQGNPSTMFANSHRQMPGCPPVRCTNFSPLIMVLVSNALLGRRNKKSQEDKEDCLPEGFEARMEGRGLIIRGRALQVLILDHEAIGVKEWLRVHGDHVKSEAVEKAITQIIMAEEAEGIRSRAKKLVDILAPTSVL